MHSGSHRSHLTAVYDRLIVLQIKLNFAVIRRGGCAALRWVIIEAKKATVAEHFSVSFCLSLWRHSLLVLVPALVVSLASLCTNVLAGFNVSLSLSHSLSLSLSLSLPFYDDDLLCLAHVLHGSFASQPVQLSE